MQVKLFIRDRSSSYLYKDVQLAVEVTDKEGNTDWDYISLSELAQGLKPFLLEQGLKED